MKTCSKCGIEKNLSEFYKDKTRTSGIRSNCKECDIAFNHSESRKDYLKEYHKEYSKKNKDKKKKYDSSLKGKYISYKTSAKVRNIDFLLTEDQFLTFWNKDCSYCGDKIQTVGIDRIDSSKGYYIENCVSCCERCNKIFMHYNKKETINHIQKMLNRLNNL